MDVAQRRFEDGAWQGRALREADLVLVFAGVDALAGAVRALRADHPHALVAGCSTAGDILGTQVSDGGAVATAVRFRATRVQGARVLLEEGESSAAAGSRLVGLLPRERLRHVVVLSDGLHVNGSLLVAGMSRALPAHVAVTGGLAGDGDRFGRTATAFGDEVRERQVVAVGLYGDALRVGFGSLGGWDPFGPQRRVTQAEGNVLHRLDGRPALALYKEYLGAAASGLPAAGLLFPLSVRLPGHDREVVRTILGVDEATQTLTFAGDLPEGSLARLMKANFDRLVDGAQEAARTSHEALGAEPPELALLISCVGRRLVLRQRVEEELEAVRETLGPAAALTGFYSYGEICPAAPEADCELHNQTMTVTTFREA